MGMDQAPACGIVISHDSVRKIVPAEMRALETLMKENGSDWSELADAIEGGDEDYEHPDEFRAFDVVRRAFAKATQVPVRPRKGKPTSHLDLYIGLYNEEKGGLYDDLHHEDGAYFTVGGSEKLTGAGRKFERELNTELWSQFG